MAIRLYEFRVNGYVPGIPGEFPGGSQVLVDEDTNQVIAQGPLGVPLAIPEPPPQEAQPSPVQQPPVDPLADALQKLGG